MRSRSIPRHGRGRSCSSGYYEAVEVLGPGPALVKDNVVLGDFTAGVAVYTPNVHATIVANTVLHGSPGIVLSEGSVAERNFVTGTRYGIEATGGVVRHNRVEGNDADGIRALGSTVVSHNTANYNGELGINADPSVIDGGGNRAKGNGNPLQCLNVFWK